MSLSIEPQLRAYVRAARDAAARTLGAPVARHALAEPEAPASVLWLAALSLLGPDLLVFEPETLHRELPELPQQSWDKLHAAICLQKTPLFWDDFRTYGNTCLAFCDDLVLVNVVPQPDPAQMAWTAVEAELLFVLDGDAPEPEISDEVTAYTAHLLYDEGYVVAPELLAFADDVLSDLLNPDAKSLRGEVQEIVKTARTTDVSSVIRAQLERLALVERYVETRLKRGTAALTALR